MKKKVKFQILLILGLFVCVNTQAQIESEIKNYVDSNEIIINNARKYIVQCFQEDNPQKVKEVYQYLMLKGEQRKCSALSFKEQLLMGIIMCNWDELLLLMENYGSPIPYLCYSNLVNIDDPLYESIRKSLPKINEEIENKTLPNEEKELLKILIHLVQFGSKNKEYDLLISDFRKKYPSTKYSNFSKDYLPNPTYKASISYSLGSKYTFLSPEIAKLFENNLGIAFSMDFCISKVYVSMYMEGGAMKSLMPITLSNEDGETHNFNTGSSFTRLDIGFKTGYYLIRNEKIHLAPYASLLAGGYLQSNLYKTDNQNNKEFDIYNSFTPGVGLHFEYKLGNYKIKNYYQNMNSIGNSGYFSLKFDGGFDAISKFNYASLTGNKTYMTLGIVCGAGVF